MSERRANAGPQVKRAAATALRAASRRNEAARAALETHVCNAYRNGVGIREIARSVNHSHPWVISVLKAHGVYESKGAA